MSLPEYVPLAEVKNRLSEVVERIERAHGRVVVTKYGRPAAVIMSIEDLESLEETLEILGNPALMADLAKAEAEIKARKTTRLTKEQALTLVRRKA